MQDLDSKSAATYEQYRADIAGSTLVTSLRFGIVVVVALHAPFLFLDYYAFPESFAALAITRTSNFVTLGCAYALASRAPERTMIASCVIAGLHLVAVIGFAGGVSSLYFPGLMLLFLGMPVLLPMSAKQSAGVVSILMVAFAGLPLSGFGELATRDYFVNLVFPGAAAIESVFSCALLDRLRFRDFQRREEIAAARDELKILDDAKSRFSANVHHELRTPLTLMLAPLEGLRSGDYGAVSQTFDKTFKTMHVNGQRLLKLINNLLDLAKLESSQFEVYRAPVELDQLVENIVIGALPMAERKQIDLFSSVPAPAPQLYADAEALEKILVNLLGNALKFTEPGGEIEIGVDPKDEGVEIFVRDSGIGLTTDQLGRVFDRFAQVDSSATRKHEGTGIGLSLTQELISLHEGQIWAESDGDGQGTTMRFFLPTGEPDSGAEEAVVVTAESGDVTTEGSLEAARAELDDAGSSENPQAVPASNPLHFVDLDRSAQRWEGQQGDHATEESDANDDRPEILVADDNEDMRELVSFILGKDFRVRSARNGREALDLLQDFVPDLVVSDIMMPEMSGTELCQAIKTDERLAQVPVMLVSSKAEGEMKIQGLELGADDYVTKPFHPRELLARARAHASLHRARRDLAAQNHALANALEDLQSTEAQLIQSERLAAVGEIAAGIAHEVNNPVNYALNAARALSTSINDVVSIAESAATLDWNDPDELARKGTKLREEIDYAGGTEMAEAINELTEIVTNGLDRTRKLVGDLRDFAKPTREDGAIDIDLVESIESALQLVRSEIERAGVTIAWTPPKGLPEVFGHPTEIGQVVLNLVKNAAEAIGNGDGTVTVEASVVTDHVALRVSDDGPGIPEDVVPHIFDPFFTTKAAGEGTGLGLAVCRKIIAAQGGALEYEPTPGGGATFVLTLPTAAGPS